MIGELAALQTSNKIKKRYSKTVGGKGLKGKSKPNYKKRRKSIKSKSKSKNSV